MIENFAQNYAFFKEQTIGKGATPSYEDFTNKILPAMFGDRPYIRVTYNTDMKIWEYQKKYRKKEEKAKGIHLDSIINSENIALWYKINPNWINYCQKVIKASKPAYIILSQIKDRKLHFCTARITNIHSVREIYEFPKQNTDLFRLSQAHESNNLYNFKSFETLKDEQQAKIIKWLAGKEIGQEPLTETRSAITYSNKSEIVTIPEFVMVHRKNMKDSLAFSSLKYGGIPTLTHSYLPIHINEYGVITIGTKKMFSNAPALKIIFLLALFYKKKDENIILDTKTIQQFKKTYPIITNIHKDNIAKKIRSIVEYGNLRKNIEHINEELNKHLSENMYDIYQEIGTRIKFKKEFDSKLISINELFYEKLKTINT
jgi:hypothetical protein